MASIPSPSFIDVVSHRLGIEPALTTYLTRNNPTLIRENPADSSAIDSCITHCQSEFYDYYFNPYGKRSPERPPLNTYQNLVLHIGEGFFLGTSREALDLEDLKRAITKDPSIINTRTPLIFERCLRVSYYNTDSDDSLVNTTLLMLAFLRRKYRVAQFLLQQPDCDVHAVSTCGLRAIECLAMERVLGNNPNLISHLEAWETNSSPEAQDCLNTLLEKDVDLLPLEDNPKPTIFHLFALHDNVEGLTLVLNKQKCKIEAYNRQILRIVKESMNTHLPDVLSTLTSQYAFRDLSTILEMRCAGNFHEFEVMPPLGYYCLEDKSLRKFTCIESYTPLLAALNSGATRTAALLLQEGADPFARTAYSDAAKAISKKAKDWSVDDFIEGGKIPIIYMHISRPRGTASVGYLLQSGDERRRHQLCDLLKKHREEKLRTS